MRSDGGGRWCVVAVSIVVGVDVRLCIYSSPSLGFYDCPFPDKVFVEAGIWCQPSVYGISQSPVDMASTVTTLRQVKEASVEGLTGVSPTLLPWLTACTYGQLDARGLFNEAVTAFGAGSTGWSFFWDTCFDDMGKMLALSSAVGLAGPYESVLVNGSVLGLGTDLNGTAGVDAVSGMAGDGVAWLAVTPSSSAGSVSVSVKGWTTPEDVVWVCWLGSGEVGKAAIENGAASVLFNDLTVGLTAVGVVSSSSECEKADVWLPSYE